MNAFKIEALILGVVGLGIGAIGVLAGLGYLPRGHGDASIPMAQQQAVAIGIGVIFGAAGASALLQAFPGAAASLLYKLLGFVIVGGLFLLFGWVALGSGSRGFSSPLEILGPRVNELVGRVLFGVVAVMGLMMLIRMARGAFWTRSPTD